MPRDAFYCEDCKKPFEVILTLEEYEKGQIKCPICGKHHVHQEATAFFAVQEKLKPPTALSSNELATKRKLSSRPEKRRLFRPCSGGIAAGPQPLSAIRRPDAVMPFLFNVALPFMAAPAFASPSPLPAKHLVDTPPLPAYCSASSFVGAPFQERFHNTNLRL